MTNPSSDSRTGSGNNRVTTAGNSINAVPPNVIRKPVLTTFVSARLDAVVTP